MSNETIEIGPKERALLMGDLSKLSEADRGELYASLCRSLDLNPLTNPFSYMQLKGKWMFYASKSCTDQLRSRRNISIYKMDKELDGDLLTVVCYARDASGREDQDVGVVDLTGLKGEMKANAVMKTITKAKRRVTLSICGLGMLDETEIETIPGIKTALPGESLDVKPYTPAELNAARGSSGNISPSKLAYNEYLAKEAEAASEPKEFIEAREAREHNEKEAERLLAPPSGNQIVNHAPQATGGFQAYKCKFGKEAGKSFEEIGAKNVASKIEWIKKEAKPPISSNLVEFMELGQAYLASLS